METSQLIKTAENSLVSCRNSLGVEIRATPVRMTRHLVVFEVYNPYSILQLSEVLQEFRIFISQRLVYSGRAVVSNLVNTGIFLVCEASLDDSWLDIDLFSPTMQFGRLRAEFDEFLGEFRKNDLVVADFKLVVSDLQGFLSDLRRWLEQLEFLIGSHPQGDRAELEREAVDDLSDPLVPAISPLFERFEKVARSVPEDLQPTHRVFVRKHLHPLVLCSPFVWRTYTKPLGYAGDYEMVNMILGDPLEGTSLFAKAINFWFWKQAPAEAHRNRVDYLAKILEEETRRAIADRNRTRVKIMNLGCGPAKEIQRFLEVSEVSNQVDFVLWDFNQETLQSAGAALNETKERRARSTLLDLKKQSVNQILKDSNKASALGLAGSYDMVYCAGLFDYLSDRICKRLINVFFNYLAPGGLLTVTNVHPSNPRKETMGYVLDWHLVYRNESELKALTNDLPEATQVKTRSDGTGVNLYLEVRKPAKE